MTTSINLINLKETYLHKEAFDTVEAVFGEDTVRLLLIPQSNNDE